jgi:fumarate hydratase class I
MTFSTLISTNNMTTTPTNKPQVKLASVKYLDNLPSAGDPNLGTAFRDLEWEAKVLKLTQDLGIGAQFGGK